VARPPRVPGVSLDGLAMLRADGRRLAAGDRHEIATRIGRDQAAGTLLLATCHRVELTGEQAAIDASRRRIAHATSLEHVRGEAVAEHLLRVAVGLDSAVLGEDQVLHQLRVAVGLSRARGSLPPTLDRLLDTALRIGRRARSWLPASRPSLADLALDRVEAGRTGGRTRPVLVVGAGVMGALAARAVRARGLPLLVASRTPERAAHLAEAWHGRPVGLDPGASIDVLEGVVVALSGPWAISAGTADRLARVTGWLVDLSAPTACDPALARALGTRFLSIDDLAMAGTDAERGPLRSRLEELVRDGLSELHAWAAAAADREAAQALTRQADEVRLTELEALWQETAGLTPEERASVERMAERLTRRLLRAPIERLGRDADGRYQRAARDLFGL
jgi:glutamyl-tRNA reductase